LIRIGLTETVEVFVDFLSSHIIDTGKFRVIDRMQREALLREVSRLSTAERLGKPHGVGP